MAITKWDPFGDLLDLNRQVVKLFGQDSPREFGRWVPAIDMFERDNKLVLKAELAGVSPDDVDITIENGILTIIGEKNSRKKSKRKIFIRLNKGTEAFRGQ